MQKKRFLYAVLLIIILPFVYADEEGVIYSGTIYSNQTEKVGIGNQTFTFDLIGSGHLIVDLPSYARLIVQNGSCDSKEGYDICTNGSTFLYYDNNLNKEVYSIDVKIYKFEKKAEIELTKIIESAYLLIDEETKINIELENTGDTKAVDIVYLDIIPSDFEIVKTVDVIIEKINSTHRNIRWEGSLLKGKKTTFVYKIKALNKITFESKPSLAYNDGVEIIKADTGTQTITVPDYRLNMTYGLDKEKIKIDGEASLDIILTNIDDKKDFWGTSLIITIPQGLEIMTNSEKLIKDENGLRWTGKISKQGSVKFNIKLKGKFIKNHTLGIKTAFSINGTKKNIEKTINLEVYGDTLTIEPIIDKSVQSSAESDIFIQVRNPSTKYSFKDVELTLESNIPGIEKIKRNLGKILKPLGHVQINNISFIAPEQNKDYSINITLRYLSEYGQFIKVKQEHIVTVIRGEDKEERYSPETVVEETIQEPKKIIKETQEEESKEKDIFISNIIMKLFGIIFIALIVSYFYLIKSKFTKT
ncbi:MAG: hypothetical protein KAU20_02590 [Nanoarchaeota archaeon]|nr:hypothetical protein [Nanoarchaeota archaeon]